VPPSNAIVEKVTGIDEKHTVLFEFNHTDISKKGLEVISDLSQRVKKMAGYSVDISGHTDTAGSKEYNDVLSLERAKTVSDVLVKEGADKTKITTKGLGESSLAVETADEVKEPRNRRVEIHLKGKEISESSF
jgi:outer membrane protein OmpA-like peptidoglycan-associated protein